jgi:hypothetical protein
MATENQYDKYRPLVFMHVPKCGGTSLDISLQRSLGISQHKRFFGTVLHGDTAPESYRSWDDNALRHVAIDDSYFTEQSDYIVAHASFRELHKRHPDAQFITFLREPICRLLSLRTYLRTFSDEMICYFGNYGIFNLRARLPLKEFLKHPYFAANYDNTIVRMLLDGNPLIPRSDFIKAINDDELLSSAISVLDKFDFFGAIEDKEGLQRLQQYLGSDFSLLKENESINVPEHLQCDLHSELDDETMEILYNHSRLDVSLWKHAMRLTNQSEFFKTRLSLISQCVSRHSKILCAKN